jgi:hypothetical protein
LGEKQWTWTKENDSDYQGIKTALRDLKQLHFLDPSEPMLVASDASKYGMQKEAFGLYHVVTSNRHILLGRHFTLITDHRNIIYISPSSDMIARWL